MIKSESPNALNNDYIFSLLNKGMSIILGVFISAFLNRYLGPELRGDYAYIINIINIVVIIANLGFYESYPFQKRNCMKNQMKIYLNTFSFQFLVYIIIIGIASIFLKSTISTLALMLIPIQVLMNQLSMIALVEFIRFRQKLQISILIINFFMTLSLLLLFPKNLLYAIIVLMSKDVCFILCYLVKIKYIPNPTKVSFKFIKFLISFGKFAMLSTLLIQLNYRVDVLFLKNLSDSVSVGLYSVGIGLAEYVWLIPDAFKEVLFSRTARDDSVGEIIYSIKINMAITIFILLVVLVLGQYIIILLYGYEFAESYHLTCIVFLGIPSMVLYKLINPLYWANGKQKFMCITLTISVLLNMIFNCILIPLWGKEGAAIASVISYTMCGMVFYIRFIRDYNIKWYNPLIMRRKDIITIWNMIKKRK